MILLKGSLLLPVPQKTQCLRDQERIYGDNQQQHVGRFWHHFLSVQERIPWIVRGSGLFCLQRAFFNQVTKVTRDCFDLHLPRSVIGLENSRHPLNQSNAKFTPMPAFSRASVGWLTFTPSSDWLILVLRNSIETNWWKARVQNSKIEMTTDKCWDRMFYLIALLQQWRPPERIIRTYPIAFPKEK